MDVDLQQLVRQMKALANENRLAMYLSILEHEYVVDQPSCMICDVAAKFNLGAPTISHHIKVLEAAGLITVKKHGKFISATINPQARQMAMRAFNVRPEQ